MDNLQIFSTIGWIITGIMIIKLPNLIIKKTLLANCRRDEAINLLQQNIRRLSIGVKLLLFITNFLRPSDKGWAGQIDLVSHQAQIMRLPHWYDINPFSLKINCQFVNKGNQQSEICLTPLLNRKTMIIDYFIVSTIALILQFIQMAFSQDTSLGIIDIIQMALIILFPLSFYVEWQLSLYYFKKMFDKAQIETHFQ